MKKIISSERSVTEEERSYIFNIYFLSFEIRCEISTTYHNLF
jgi:hypothetical protein